MSEGVRTVGYDVTAQLAEQRAQGAASSVIASISRLRTTRRARPSTSNVPKADSRR